MTRFSATVEAPILRRLLQDVVDKATPFGDLDEPGGSWIAKYLLPTGPIHRALAFLRDGVIPTWDEVPPA